MRPQREGGRGGGQYIKSTNIDTHLRSFCAGELGTDGTCKISDKYQGVAMTLIDSLSTLAVLGNSSEFQKQVRWLINNVSSASGVCFAVSLWGSTWWHPQLGGGFRGGGGVPVKVILLGCNSNLEASWAGGRRV